MKYRRAIKKTQRATPASALTHTLGRAERVKNIVEECAGELSSVNAGLKRELDGETHLPGVENALEKSEGVETKVQNASDELSLVNLALKAEVQERHELEDQLAAVTRESEAARHAALHDDLTGLPNRALFNDRLEHGLIQATRHGFSLAVMFLDLDDFKQINDSHGHDVGDIVLKTVAERLRSTTRGNDTVCRHGGDEFLYILMEVRDEVSIADIAQKIIKAIQAPCPIEIRDLQLSLNIKPSIGISIFSKHGTTADALLDLADKAMYQAKRSKSGYSFACLPEALE